MLDTFLEKKVNDFLEKAGVEGNVTIRVISSRDKEVEVKPSMKSRQVSNQITCEENRDQFFFNDPLLYFLKNFYFFQKYGNCMRYLQHFNAFIMKEIDIQAYVRCNINIMLK